VIAAIPVGADPIDLADDPGSGFLFVTNAGNDNVTVIDGPSATVALPGLAVGSFPTGIAYDPVNGEVYVADSGSDLITVLNATTDTTVTAIVTQTGPDALAVDPSNGNVYVADPAAGNLSVVNGTTNRIVGNPVPIGTGADGLALDTANGDLYVAVAGTNHVEVVATSSDSIVASLPVGSSPSALAFDPATDSVFVTNSASNNVTVIDTLTNQIRVAGIPVGTFPEGIAFDPVSGALYVANFASDNVSVINGSTDQPTPASYIVPAGPQGLVYDPGTGELFVASSHANLVTATPVGAPPRYSVSFSETGLSPGTGWSVTLAGTRTTSGTPTISFSESAGTYPYRIGPVVGYQTPVGGNVTVVHSAVPIAVTFLPNSTRVESFPVTFQESGLPIGTPWSVNLSEIANESQTSIVGFSEPNGTYPFTATAVGFTLNGSTDFLTVAGRPLTLDLAFVPVELAYPVAFSESGLPNGSIWWVVLGPGNATSGDATITYQALNGTWNFRIGGPVGYAPSPSTGSVTVHGSPVTRTIAFSPTGGSSSGLPLLLIVGVGLGILLLVLVLVLWMRRGRDRAPTEPDEAEVVEGPWVRPSADEESPP